MHQFEEEMRAVELPATLLWVTPGPTIEIALHAGYTVNHSLVYVQAFRGGAWRAFVAASDGDATGVIDALDGELKAPNWYSEVYPLR